MKKVLVAMISAVIIIIIIMTGFTIHGRGLRKTELSNALESSMQRAMNLLLIEEGGPKTEDEWKSMFLQSLVLQIESTSDLKVTFLEVDMEKGILSVEATLTWKHPIGTNGSVSETRTVIIEEYNE